MVRRIQAEKKMSSNDLMQKGQIVTDLGGRSPRRTVSFGDVTMGALYKNIDRKKLVRLHKWTQEINRKRQLLNRFRRAVRLTVFCMRQARTHKADSVENEFSPFMKMDGLQGEFEPDDLLFDPSQFKANKESRITDEFVRIMSKQAHERTEQEIYYALIALRNIQCFEDFPARMQRKIAECGLYEK
ncbi:uncharacterized protein LOC101860076 [Aplysia californica]|uniref:Uncharacterized protein LOC101860076 n=1 Tax=Aplysia californica TaxID=6500 RepID=A0ABM0JF51_APLCA|nr:uncharacterized protein LOC101860076 [Aplysia californica]